jgi:hypothetical protein
LIGWRHRAILGLLARDAVVRRIGMAAGADDKHLPLEQIDPEELPPPPLDCVEFRFRGTTFRVFGILHGITGGMNRTYRRFVRDHVRRTAGLKLAEKGMKAVYRGCGIDRELEDWMVLRGSDCFLLGLQLVLDPRCLRMITVDTAVELMGSRDPFVADPEHNASHLGESPYFHYLSPGERRRLIGFASPTEGLRTDLRLLRRWWSKLLPRKVAFEFPNPKWERILLMSRLMHIPARSLHMLHFAAAHAESSGLDTVNVFAGETHNTDMRSLAEAEKSFRSSLDDAERRAFDAIVSRAERFGGGHSLGTRLHMAVLKLKYIALITAGACTGVAIWVLAALALLGLLS